jgi:hypothetical protein
MGGAVVGSNDVRSIAFRIERAWRNLHHRVWRTAFVALAEDLLQTTAKAAKKVHTGFTS